MPASSPDNAAAECDVAVIGGGPAGTVVATLLAGSGHSVTLFEMKGFPRFHIGESLVPAVNLTLEKLGLLSAMDDAGFQRKHGVQFFSPKGPSRPFYFSEARDPRMHQTWQVLRSDFDAMLLENAIRSGVTLAAQTEVLGAEITEGAVRGVRVRGPDLEERRVNARVVVDASGQPGVLARKLGGRDAFATQRIEPSSIPSRILANPSMSIASTRQSSTV